MRNNFSKKFILAAVILLGISAAGLSTLPAHANEPSAATANLKPEEKEALELTQKIDALRMKISETVLNDKGIPVSKFGSPSELLAIVEELQILLQKSAQNNFLSRPETAREVVLSALRTLYKGRGRTANNGDGWNLANRGISQGMYEIETILSYGLLDEEGKKSFIHFLETHDFNDPTMKKSVGFPPQFEIGSEALRAQVLASTQSSRVAPAYQAMPVIGNLKLTVKQIAQSIKDPEADEAAKALLSVAEHNHFDSAVNTMNAGKELPHYWGREKEQNEVIDILSKGQKQHILMEGPAGAGKTTLLRALQDRFVKGEISIRNEPAPILLELPITAVTNPSDPSQIKEIVAKAVKLSEKTNRRVILMFDEAHVATSMTQNALKGFLTEITRPADGHPKVHVAFLTTSAESQKFMQDTAFSRRFSSVHVNPFNREDTIKLIRQTLLPRWKKDHQKNGWNLQDITDEAMEYAYRYRKTEQQFSETGTQELLEAAITAKMNRDTDSARNGGKKAGAITLDVSDIRDYIRGKFNIKLMPGDPNFNESFEKMWAEFESNYVGNETLKADLKAAMRTHFGQPHKNNLTALAVFGPPGGGKSYGAEQIAKTFFNGAILETSGAELKNGGLELNKLIGSPSGVKDSESRGELTRMLREHPEGFVWLIEEGDYMHPDIVNLKTNIITSKKFKDGLGKEWDASKIIIWENSNIGQDLMIPRGSENQMNWTQYDLRRHAITQKALVNGKEVEKVRPDIMNGVFRNYIEKIVTNGSPNGDTSAVEQEAAKQIRRYTPLYVMPPNKEELIAGAKTSVKKYIESAKLEHGVKFELSDDALMKLIDLDQYNFKMGHGYINKQLERKLYDVLLPYLSRRGETIKVAVEDAMIQLDGHDTPSQNLLVEAAGKIEKHNLGAADLAEKNPWGTNPEMMKRMENFVPEMSQHIKGNQDILQDMSLVLKEKSVDWNANTTFTLLGTSGNGKTETAKSLAKVLFGAEDAMFTITGVDHPWQLSDYLRPPTGIQGSNKETAFERWFHSRKAAGGGVILFDELMSEIGKNSGVSVEGNKGGKLAVLQELYEFLAERKLKIAGVTYDARAFIPVITGNTLQEVFSGLDDNPETEMLVKKIREQLTRSKIVEALEKNGMDAPKIARLGRIYVLGPQPGEVALDVGKMKLEKAIQTVKKNYRKPIDIKIDPEAIPSVVKRLSTVKLGMREVEAGFRTLVLQPLNTIIADLAHTQKVAAKKIEMKLKQGAQEHELGEMVPQWFVDGKEVVLEAHAEKENQAKKLTWVFKDQLKKGASVLTPTTKDLKSVERMKVTPELLREIAEHEFYGHWMVNALLSRENGADFISLIPGTGYLGYVRPKQQEIEDVKNLTSLMKRTLELEAGHRANHYHGNYATGGGNDGSARVAGKEATDDLGKIHKNFKLMINNSMIPGIAENSSEAEKQFVIKVLEDVIDHATDEIIHVGVDSKQFDPMFEQLMKDRYAKRETLEEFVKKLDMSKFGYKGRDALFLEKLSVGFVQVITEKEKRARELESIDEKASIKMKYEASKVKEFSRGFLSRLFVEAETNARGNKAILSEIEGIKSELVAVMKGAKALPESKMALKCKKLYENLLSY